MGLFGDAFGLGKGIADARKAEKSAKKNRQQQLAFLEGTDWEPMYASDRVPTYQKSQSPVARGYLESLLAGNNPDATFSGSPNAGMTKQFQQGQQNAMFGTPEQRVNKGQQLLKETPWKVTSPAAKGANDPLPLNDKAAFSKMRSPIIAEAGLTSEDLERIKKATGGVDFAKSQDAHTAGSKGIYGEYAPENFKVLKEAIDRGVSDEKLAELVFITNSGGRAEYTGNGYEQTAGLGTKPSRTKGEKAKSGLKKSISFGLWD